MDLAEKNYVHLGRWYGEYNRGLLGLSAGIRSTEYHSSGVTNFLKRS